MLKEDSDRYNQTGCLVKCVRRGFQLYSPGGRGGGGGGTVSSIDIDVGDYISLICSE